MHIDSQKSVATNQTASTSEETESNGRPARSKQELLSGSIDPDPKSSQTPFKDRIRPGMVVRWSPPDDFSMKLPGLNMVIIMCPLSAAGRSARDVNGNLVLGEGGERKLPEGAKYLCSLVVPGFMADSYELSMWRQVVVDVEQMEAEVLLEYDAATRYYHITL